MINIKKGAVIGCGMVGSAIAFALMQKGLFSQLVLIDAKAEKAEGEAMDLADGMPYGTSMDIYAGDYSDLKDCALAVIAAGAGQKPGEKRTDLIGRNVAILRDVIPNICRSGFSGILLVVSNPVDALTCAAWKLSGFPPSRVMGSGTVLDTARLKQLLGEKLRVDPKSVHAFIIGEHGDSELAVWSSASVSGIGLKHFWELRGCGACEPALGQIYESVRDSAYEIIQRKGATYYGIAMAVLRIVCVIVNDEHSVLPVSVPVRGQYGLEGLCLSLPALVGKEGIEEILEIPLDKEEERALWDSAACLKTILKDL